MIAGLKNRLRSTWRTINPHYLKIVHECDKACRKTGYTLNRYLDAVNRTILIPAIGHVRYYSQWGEDRLLSPFVSPGGLVVDVGANDGVSGSNSRYFVLKGMRAVCVEPDPRAFARLERLYRGSGKVVTLNCTCGESAGRLHLYLGETTQLSTLDPASAPGRKPGEGVSVEVRTLDNILEAAPAGPIEVLSIDVEGAEWGVLAGFSPGRWAPKFIVIETHNFFSKFINRDMEKIVNYFETSGYHLCGVTMSNCLWASGDAGVGWLAPAGAMVERREAAVLQMLSDFVGGHLGGAREPVPARPWR